MTARMTLGKGFSVLVDVEVADDLGVYQEGIPRDLVEDAFWDLGQGQANRSRKTVFTEPYAGAQSIVQVTYGGFLSASSSRGLYFHYGYGCGWSAGGTLPMVEGSAGRWGISVVSRSAEPLNFCFVDGFGNWDNNGGRDWSLVPERVLSH